jgi:single-strand DNA-binding protein
MNLNKVFVLGNLTKDPEIRTTPSGTAVCSFNVATNRHYTTADGTKKQEPEFHAVVAWGKQAELVRQYLKKGSLLLVEGRLQTRDWEDDKGVKHYRTEVVAEGLQFGPKIGKKADAAVDMLTAAAEEVAPPAAPVAA